jgi:hypothetical protein
MKQVLTILTFFLTTLSYAQKINDIDSSYSARYYDDSSLKFQLSILNEFDSVDKDKNIFCQFACERIGDIYKFRKKYLMAISYYDSADSKYAETGLCGNGLYPELMQRYFKASQCYMEVKNTKQALSKLTPYIFDSHFSYYLDSNIIIYYLKLLASLYSKEEIQNEIDKAIQNIDYSHYYRWTLDSSAKYININCKIEIFGEAIELAGYETSSDKDNEIPVFATKEYFITQLKDLDFCKRLHN